MSDTESFGDPYRIDDKFANADLAVAELRTAFRIAELRIPDITADNVPGERPLSSMVEILSLPPEDARRVARLMLLGCHQEKNRTPR